MNNEKDPLLLDHEADGIRELDNQLPRWWVWLFNLTIFFAGAYLLYYHVFDRGALMAAEYRQEMEVGEKVKQAALDRFEKEMLTMAPSTDAAVLEEGKQVFTVNCVACHRADAGGLVGPNLTDDYWIHGSEFKDTLQTISNGVPEKGMVTWKGLLKPTQIYAVASYIYTLRGSNPPNPKPPENTAPATPQVNIYE
ncbi:MAG: c-type cytochrome [Verrucomicrobiales bacterium]|nr:c-type cytochrome [Verrucomicrobiales bacterium]